MGQAASDEKGNDSSELKQDETCNGNSAPWAFTPQISSDSGRQKVPQKRLDPIESLTTKLERIRAMQAQSSLEEPLVGPPVLLARSEPGTCMAKVRPQTRLQAQHSGVKRHVVLSKGQHAWCCDNVWDEVASCVVFDFFKCHVWSRPLAAMSLLGLMVGLSNYTLAGLLPVAMSASCIGARNLGSCNRSVCTSDMAPGITIPIDPEFLMDGVQTWLGKNQTIHDAHHAVLRMKQLELGWDVNLWLILFVLVYIANSAYRMQARTSLSWMWLFVRTSALLMGAIWLQAMLDFTENDIWYCDNAFVTKKIEWKQYHPDPGFHAEWPRKVAEFCSFGAAHKLRSKVGSEDPTSFVNKQVSLDPSRQNQTLDRNASLVGEEVKNVWAAWMQSATFNISFVNKSEARAYCEQLLGSQQPAVVVCVAWMNSTKDMGNRIECLQNVKNTIPAKLSKRMMLQWMMGRNRNLASSDDIDYVHDLVTSFNDIDYLDDLATAGCHAIIPGSNFALKPPSEIQGLVPWPPGFVSEHVLSLATQGLQCSEYDTSGSGTRQAVASNGSTCKYSNVLLQKRGSKLELKDNVSIYMHREFVDSIITQVDKCEGFLYTFAWTSLASIGIYSFVAVMCALYVWMTYLHLGSSRPIRRLIVLLVSAIGLFGISEFNTSGCKSCDDGFEYLRRNKLLVLSVVLLMFHVSMSLLGHKFWPVPSYAWGSIHTPEPDNRGDSIGVAGQSGLMRMRCSEWLRTIFSSRVMLGFALSTLLQVSFTYALTLFVFPLADGAKANCQDDLCRNGIFSASRGAVFGQCAIVLIAVVWNTQRYLWLRQHIMALPYDVIFGDETNMEHRYYGPDLVDFKDMAASSALLAMQFPVGPLNAIYDFIFGLLTCTLSKMIVDKPSFVQYGELSDYVYCSYCALLYLERVREEERQRDMIEQANDSEVARSTSKVQDLEPQVDRSGYKSQFPCWCCGFCVFQLALPLLVIWFIARLGWVLPAFPSDVKKYNEVSN